MADGAEGIFSPFEGRMLMNDWSREERAVMIALLAACSINRSLVGILHTNAAGLHPYVDAIQLDEPDYTVAIKKINAGLKGLENRKVIKRYKGGLIWLIDRWSYTKNRRHPNIIAAARKSVTSASKLIWDDFAAHYELGGKTKAKPKRQSPAEAKEAKLLKYGKEKGK
jgi:hypothetical protein